MKTAVLEPMKIASMDTGNGSSAENPEYTVDIEIVGTVPLKCHRWDTGAVEAKGKAAKGSREKKSDNLESYVYRDEKGVIGVPGACFKAALREAGRRMQDPSSPRKSAVDLIKSSIRVGPFIASLGKTKWDYIDECRAVVQRSAISRQRPAFREGWALKFAVDVLAPEYITVAWLQELATRAGRFQGLLDHRPEYGLFRIVSFKQRSLAV